MMKFIRLEVVYCVSATHKKAGFFKWASCEANIISKTLVV